MSALSEVNCYPHPEYSDLKKVISEYLDIRESKNNLDASIDAPLKEIRRISVQKN